MKRLLIVLSVFVLWFSVVKGQVVQADSGFAGGSGTTADPWQISTPEQLNKLREKDGESGFRYILINDIDLTFDTQDPDGLFYNDGQGWEPIADFRGRLNGNGYTILGLYIDRPDEDSVGLFGVKEGGHIRNLRLSNAYVRGDDSVGALIGFAVDTELWAVELNEVSVEGDDDVGGLIGFGEDIRIFGAHVFQGEGSIIVGNANVGSLIGYAERQISVSHVINHANVQGQGFSDSVGGLIGRYQTYSYEEYEEYFELSYAENHGTIIGWDLVGGLVGYIVSGFGSGSYSLHYVANHGLVMGNAAVGGIVGSSEVTSFSEGWLNTGTVSGTFNVGGLIGYHDLSFYGMTFSAGTNTGSVTGNDNTGALFGNMVNDSGESGFNIWNMQALDSELEVVGSYLGEPLVSDYTTYNSVEELFESSSFAYVREGTNNFFGYELVDGRIQAKQYNMVDILGDGTVTGQSNLNWIQYFIVSELLGFMSVSDAYYDFNLGVNQPTFGYSFEEGAEFVFNFSRDREDDDIGMEELLPVTPGRKFVFLYVFDANAVDEEEELPQTSDRSLLGSFMILLLGLVLVSKSNLKKI